MRSAYESDRTAEPQTAPSALWIDDWAWRRGRRYGTVLLDLERNRPIHLLPGRALSTLANWLKRHPGVKVVARDRASAYAEGAREGAPNAVRVADRWHLLRNLSEAVLNAVERCQAIVTEVGREIAMDAHPPMQPAGMSQRADGRNVDALAGRLKRRRSARSAYGG